TITMKDVNGNHFNGEILDVTGRKVSSFTFSDRSYTIKRNGLKSGIYFLRLTSDQQESYSAKIIFTE
ncbi:MAG TPA: T9SS type A sorting domain-containing protein, partial [Bacteroidia bacterium]